MLREPGRVTSSVAHKDRQGHADRDRAVELRLFDASTWLSSDRAWKLQVTLVVPTLRVETDAFWPPLMKNSGDRAVWWNCVAADAPCARARTNPQASAPAPKTIDKTD